MKRILVVLPNWFGETLFATPFLRSLRQELPDAFIATLGWPQCRQILWNNPCVSALLDYDERAAHRTLWAKWKIIAQLRSHRFDTAFILRKSLSRSLLLAAAGIRVRVGFDHPKSRWLLTHPTLGETGIHKAASYFPLLKRVGLVPHEGAYEYGVDGMEREEACAWLRSQKLLNGYPIVVLHPGANWAHKRWATDRFAALGNRLVAWRKMHILITGGPEDVPWAVAIQSGISHPVSVLAGRTSLRQLSAILEQAHLVIAGDTGVLHVAAALRRPIVGLFGPTLPIFTGPLGDAERIVVVHHPDCCPTIPCYQPDQPPHLGMGTITVEEVYAAACQLLGSTIAG